MRARLRNERGLLGKLWRLLRLNSGLRILKRLGGGKGAFKKEHCSSAAQAEEWAASGGKNWLPLKMQSWPPPGPSSAQEPTKPWVPPSRQDMPLSLPVPPVVCLLAPLCPSILTQKLNSTAICPSLHLRSLLCAGLRANCSRQGGEDSIFGLRTRSHSARELRLPAVPRATKHSPQNRSCASHWARNLTVDRLAQS